MILVPYAVGSATPSEVSLAAEGRGHRTTFVVDPGDAEAMAHVGLLEAFGTVIRASSVDECLTALAVDRVEPSAVVTFAEATLPVAAGIAAHFGLPGHDPERVAGLVDKGVQRARLNAEGCGSVATVTVRGGQAEADLPGHLPLPGVLKPTAGAGSRDTVFVDDASEVANELERHAADAVFVVEEAIAGVSDPLGPWLADYLSIESAVSGGRVRHLGTTGRLPLARPARERGLVFPVGVPADLEGELHDLADRAIAALGITTGLVHTEIKLSPSGPRVIEVNARLGGGLGSICRAAGGPDLVGLAVDLALGGALPDRPAPTGVALHLYVQPPFEARRLVTAPDPRAIRRLPGVYGADRRAVPGQDIDWRDGSAGRILDIWIKAPSLSALEAATATVESALATSTEWSTS